MCANYGTSSGRSDQKVLGLPFDFEAAQGELIVLRNVESPMSDLKR
jgi:hypothetical protein